VLIAVLQRTKSMQMSGHVLSAMRRDHRPEGRRRAPKPREATARFHLLHDAGAQAVTTSGLQVLDVAAGIFFFFSAIFVTLRFKRRDASPGAGISWASANVEV